MTRPAPRVLVTRAIPAAGIDLLRSVCDVEVWPEPLAPPRAELLRLVAGRAGLLVLPTERIDDEVMEAAGTDLCVVSSFSVGYDHLDVTAAARRGIQLGHTPGVLSETTADTTWALLMAAARRISEAERYVRADRWGGGRIDDLLGVDVSGATLGIIGMGRIGQAVARRARGFDMTVVYHQRHRLPEALENELRARWAPLDELLGVADFVSLHAPHSAHTHRIIDGAALALMKSSAILVNTARGSLVDSDALLDALDRGIIRGAALDDTDPEPLPPDHPLAQRDDCLVVPHIGSATVATRERIAVMAAENVLAGLRGEPLPHPVPAT